MLRGCVVVVLVGWWAVQTAQYATVWTTPTRLFTHIVEQAPVKPRAWVNYGVMLATAQQFPAARAALHHAERLTDLPSVPAYDKAITRDIVRDNLRAVDRLEARLRPTWTASALP